MKAHQGKKRPRATSARVPKPQDIHMIKMKHFAFSLFATLITGVSVLAQQKTVTIGAVNNPAMIELKKLSPKFEAQNPNIKLNWVLLHENVMRQRCTMREQPTYDDIKKFADALTDKAKDIYGITLRGKPGWGENMAYVDTLLNTFGCTWFDEKWHPTIDTPEWKKAITFYVDLMKADGPPGASANGFNENLTLLASGKAALWIDATSGAGPLYDKSQSQVSDKVAFANAPLPLTPNCSA